jgi:phospholipid/cholesterol/gamma-HCH transport system ATP-binding protein
MIEIKNIEKYFGDKHVLKNVSFTFEQGKTNLIIGESGSGKTTLIKILVGLYKNDHGTVLFNGQNTNNMNSKEIRKFRQEIGMLFQGGALYDYLTVEENIMFPLTMFTKNQKLKC